MRNSTMTGTIILSPEDSAQIRNSILNPGAEYMQTRQEYFDRLASSMTIHSEGSDTTVEFDDLDLSNLDALIEKENISSASRTLMNNSDYISTTTEVSVVGVQHRKESYLETMFPRLSFDISNTVYICTKTDGKAKNKGCNLTEAA